jgi:hypothetical protein
LGSSRDWSSDVCSSDLIFQICSFVCLSHDGRTSMINRFARTAEETVPTGMYIRRAKRGSTDAALLIGTGKDLLEAVSVHILQQRYGYSFTSNFPTLLGQVFVALGLATPLDLV